MLLTKNFGNNVTLDTCCLFRTLLIKLVCFGLGEALNNTNDNYKI